MMHSGPISPRPISPDRSAVSGTNAAAYPSHAVSGARKRPGWKRFVAHGTKMQPKEMATDPSEIPEGLALASGDP